MFEYNYFKSTSSLCQKMLIVTEYFKAGNTFNNHRPAGKITYICCHSVKKNIFLIVHITTKIFQ